jgi:hypothetical protein
MPWTFEILNYILDFILFKWEKQGAAMDQQNPEYRTNLWSMCVADIGIECRITIRGVFFYGIKKSTTYSFYYTLQDITFRHKILHWCQ